MGKNMKHIFIAWVMCVLSASCLSAATRTWKSSDGRFSVEAELTGFENEQAQLKKADGKVLSVSLNLLGPDDRELVKRYRTWKSGKFSIFAEYVDFRDDQVQLCKADGTKFSVKLEKLCTDDQRWVKDRLKEESPSPGEGPSKPVDDKALEGLGAQHVTMKLVRIDAPKGKGANINSPKTVAPAQHYLAQTRPQVFVMQARDGQASGDQMAFQKVATKEPQYKAPLPFKGVAHLNGQEYAFALDVTSDKAKGYDKLYFDLNRNGDLTDDKAVTTKDVNADAKSGVSKSQFPRVDMKLDGKDGEQEYSFNLSVECHVGGNQQMAIALLYTAAMREGYATQGGRKIHLILLDQNSNGRFDDLLSVQHNGNQPSLNQGDLLLINPNLKNLKANAAQSNDRYFLNRTICLCKKFFHLDVSPSGDSVKLEPIDLALGNVQNSSPSYIAWLTSDEYGVMMIQGTKGQKLPMPAGDWKMVSYSLNSSPSGGGGGSGLTAVFPDSCEGITVAKGKTLDLPFGAPFQTKVTAHKMQDNKIYLSLDILGAGGEKCTSLSVNGRQPPGPQFIIKDSDGKEVYKGKFEFG
jgi:hypothetical protein